MKNLRTQNDVCTFKSSIRAPVSHLFYGSVHTWHFVATRVPTIFQWNYGAVNKGHSTFCFALGRSKQSCIILSARSTRNSSKLDLQCNLLSISIKPGNKQRKSTFTKMSIAVGDCAIVTANGANTSLIEKAKHKNLSDK